VAGNTRSSLVTNTNAIVYKLENDYIGGAWWLAKSITLIMILL
jgi:hypothetical protein